LIDKNNLIIFYPKLTSGNDHEVCYLIYDLGTSGAPIGQACLSNTTNYISVLTLRVKPDFGIIVLKDTIGNSYYVFWKKQPYSLQMMGKVQLDN
jgi:hypothetical protein